MWSDVCVVFGCRHVLLALLAVAGLELDCPNIVGWLYVGLAPSGGLSHVCWVGEVLLRLYCAPVVD